MKEATVWSSLALVPGALYTQGTVEGIGSTARFSSKFDLYKIHLDMMKIQQYLGGGWFLPKHEGEPPGHTTVLRLPGGVGLLSSGFLRIVWVLGKFDLINI